MLAPYFRSLLSLVPVGCLLACEPGPSPSPGMPLLPAVSTSAGEGPSRYVNVFVGTDDAPAVAMPVPNGAGGSTRAARRRPLHRRRNLERSPLARALAAG